MPDLSTFLAETPTEHASLWCAYWGQADSGSDEPVPKIVEDIASTVASAESSICILVDGPYGTGKTSFLRLLETRIVKLIDSKANERAARPGESPKEESKRRCGQNGECDSLGANGANGVISVRLHMPIVSSGLESSTLAAIAAAMVDALRAKNGKAKDCMNLQRACDDLWRMEAGRHLVERHDNGVMLERPGDNRVSGATAANRSTMANRLESMIASCLAPDQKMLVVLDDLDRCSRDVATEVIRLLLRFGACQRIFFLIGCVRDVLEEGVDRWMQQHGGGQDGTPLVTANSALEKYVHHVVSLPGLGAPSKLTHKDLDKRYPLTELRKRSGDGFHFLSQLLERPSADDGDATLFDVFARLLLSIVQAGQVHSDPSSPFSVAGPTSATTNDGAQVHSDPNGAQPLPEVDDQQQQVGPPSVQKKDEKENSKENKNAPVIVKGSNRSEENNLLLTQTPLAAALLQLLSARQGESGIEIRLQESLRAIVSLLTLRQLKYLLRERLLAVAPGAPTAARDATASIPLLLLRANFPPYAKMWREERSLFELLGRSAFRILTPLSDRASPDAEALSLFHEQLVKTASASRLFSPEIIEKHWPKRVEERALLMNLLADLAGDNAGQPPGFTRVRDGRSPDGGPSPDEVPVFVEPADVHRTPVLTRTSHATSAAAALLVRDDEFARWGSEITNTDVLGSTIEEQVSNFQDLVLERLSQPARLQVIGDYMARFWERHRMRLTRAAAPTLSNLAVIIDDAPGMEHWCYMLFERARELDPGRANIAMFELEFLVDVLSEPSRPRPLIAGTRLKDEDDVRRKAEQIMESVQGTDNPFYRQLLEIRLHQKQSAGSTQVRECFFDAIVQHAVSLGRDAKAYDMRNGARLADAMGGIHLSMVVQGQVLGVLWKMLELLELPPHLALINLANLYVGTSEAKSREEQAGLRLNRALFKTPSSGHLQDRLAAVWSQTAATLAHWLPKDDAGRSRIAAALLACQRLGPDSQYHARAAGAWGKRKRGPTTEDLEKAVAMARPVILQMLSSLTADPTPVVDYVFGDPEEGLSELSNVEEFARFSGWLDSDLQRVLRKAQEAAKIFRTQET